MYNLLVTSRTGAWDEMAGSYEYDRYRFLEYTEDDLVSRFKTLSPEAISTLISLPTLFAYETIVDSPARVGRLTQIKPGPASITLSFELDLRQRPLSQKELMDMRVALGIDQSFELNRTHWAVKKIELDGAIRSALPEYVKENHVRRDANSKALLAIRSILDAAEPFDVTIEDVVIRVQPQRLSAEPWPSGTWGLDERKDGPWPQPLLLDCSWSNGRLQLVASAQRAGGKYKDLVSLKFGLRLISQQLVWINVAARLREDSQSRVAFSGWANLVTRIPTDPEEMSRRSRRTAYLKELLRRSDLPRALESNSELAAFEVDVSTAEVLPSPELAFRRLTHLALLKLPFLVQDLADVVEGKLYLEPENPNWKATTIPDAPSMEDEPSTPEEVGGPTVDDPGPAGILPTVPMEPAHWSDVRINIQPSQLIPQIEQRQLKLPEVLAAQLCAAISSGKHLLLVGPPGSGKTELAAAIAECARSMDYCHGSFIATASADWSTFDTIGGYALGKDGQFTFRPGVFLRALEQRKWLLLDEVNRADIDRSFGELMTVLAGGRTDTPFTQPNGAAISIGPGVGESHRMPPTFRVLATMNTWDKTSLFRLSYAVQRRFAVVYVGSPPDDIYARLLKEHASMEGEANPPLGDEALIHMKRLFSLGGLLVHRPLGPAIAIDMVRYQRHRQAGGDGLAEAVALFLLPQLEGLDVDPATQLFQVVLDELKGWATADAIAALRTRYRDLFPLSTLPEL